MAASHLLPKSMIGRVRGLAKSVLVLKPDDRRPRISQSGEISRRILCHEHEHATERFDDAAARFVRSVGSSPRLAGNGFSVANPRGRDLVLFIHAVLWRHWAADPKRVEVVTDQTFAVVEAALFRGGAPCPTMVIRTSRQRAGAPMLVSVLPSPCTLESNQAYRFEVEGFSFYLNAEPGARSPFWAAFSAGADPATVLDADLGDLADDPSIRRFLTGI
ncbi:hypothetical protein [Brevundimonas sp.]|uniref:hypothetical protein n=1 Tax=Brevundimonas sp. TaxID=1871086 RepID=UPI001A1DB9F6|nr:hypothetical protein [Brevundimonas sp.]MBJ7483505.1 hypothetical protein [Brevundimonas sp.]